MFLSSSCEVIDYCWEFSSSTAYMERKGIPKYSNYNMQIKREGMLPVCVHLRIFVRNTDIISFGLCTCVLQNRSADE